MIKVLPKEQWKEIVFSSKKMRSRYAISNFGRMAAFKNDFSDGSLLAGTMNNGYMSLKIKPGGSDIQLMAHRLVAMAFLKRKSKRHTHVLHLNHKKTDNVLKNLRWATKEEAEKHQRTNPRVINNRRNSKFGGYKLNIAKVREVKKLIKKGDHTMRSIARKFRISEMQLYRIKRGENWGHVKG